MLRYKYLLTGLIALLLILFFYLGQIGREIGQTAFTAGGDGYKNYYTLAYYVNYDSGTHFTGMNYPYGENVIYTDNQPLLGWTLKPLSKVFPFIKTHIRHIVFVLLLFSIVIAYVVLYGVLRELKLPEAYAALFALFIALMSPQTIRLNGHYSLGYAFYFPLLILLLLRFLNYSTWRYIAGLTILVTGFMFIHPYYFAISALFIACVIVASCITKKNMQSLMLLPPVIAAFLAFKIYLLLTDPVTDRTSIPWGFVMSRSTIADILLQSNGFIYHILCCYIDCKRIVFHDEGKAYIGIVAMLSLLLVGLSYLIKRLKALQLPSHLRILFIASIPVLLFAMAFPFSISTGTEQWLEYMPSSFKQFRASGRFSWVFYYTVTIVAAYTLSQIAHTIQLRTKVLFLTAIAALWFTDIHFTYRSWQNEINGSKSHISEYDEAESVIQKLKQYGLNIDSFQALLPVPYFNNGSEKLYITSPMDFKAMKFSYASSLPLAATMMSRTSISQSFNLVNMFSSPYIRKNVLTDLPSQKPFLIMQSGEMNLREKTLVAGARYLFTEGDINFYSLPLSALADDIVSMQQYVAKVRPTLHQHKNYSSNNSLSTVYLNTFDTYESKHTLMGKGACYKPEFNNEVIFEGVLPNATTIFSYEISIWFYTDERVPAYPLLTYQLYDSTGTMYVDSTLDGKYAMEIYNNWVKVTSIFGLRNTTDSLKVMVRGTHATIDELMIMPKTTTVITHYTDAQNFSFTNYPLRTD